MGLVLFIGFLLYIVTGVESSAVSSPDQNGKGVAASGDALERDVGPEVERPNQGGERDVVIIIDDGGRRGH